MNRFLGLVEIDGRNERCYVPNPGRLIELLQEGSTVLVKKAELTGPRSTPLDLVAVEYEGAYVSVDSRLPNLVVEEAVRLGILPELSGYATITSSPRFGRSRFDFRLEDLKPPCLLEVKGCTLVRERVAFFPDAPTVRGRRQLEDLAAAKQAGYRSVILFVVQRADAEALAPNDEMDPEFGNALRSTADKGVEALSYRLTMWRTDARLAGRIPILLN